MLARHGVFRMLGPQSQDSDKYSELTAEGKRYSTDQALWAQTGGHLTAPLAARIVIRSRLPKLHNLRTISDILPQVTARRGDGNRDKPEP
jgi:hypothetical protein